MALIKASASSGLNVSCGNCRGILWLVGDGQNKGGGKKENTRSKETTYINDLKNVVFLKNWWKGGEKRRQTSFFSQSFRWPSDCWWPKKSTATSIRHSRRHNASKVGKRWAWSTSSWWLKMVRCEENKNTRQMVGVLQTWTVFFLFCWSHSFWLTFGGVNGGDRRSLVPLFLQ